MTTPPAIPSRSCVYPLCKSGTGEAGTVTAENFKQVCGCTGTFRNGGTLAELMKRTPRVLLEDESPSLGEDAVKPDWADVKAREMYPDQTSPWGHPSEIGVRQIIAVALREARRKALEEAARIVRFGRDRFPPSGGEVCAAINGALHEAEDAIRSLKGPDNGK